MEFQEGALGASASILAHERALASIVLPCRSLDVARRVTRGERATRDRAIRPGADSARCSRRRRRAQLLLLDPFEKEGDRAVEDRARITIWDLATEKCLHAPQLVVALLADRELDTVTLGRRLSTIGRRAAGSAVAGSAVAGAVARNTAGTFVGGADPGAVTVGAFTSIASGAVAETGTAAGGVTAGSFRTEEGTSGRGANSATSASISRRLRLLARASTASWFSCVRCGLSIRTEVRDKAPEARASRMTGKRRQARAAEIRLQAASSESLRTSVQ